MIQKSSVPINFASGLDTKTDPKQVQAGKFLRLENAIFDKGGLLQKRNGHGLLATLPNTLSTYLTTFSGGLTALSSSNIQSYDESNKTWVAKGSYTPVSLSTLPLIRNSLAQTQCDAAVAPNGLVCTVYTETTGSAVSYKYAIADSSTGQNIVSPTLIPAASSGTVTGSPRVFVLGNYFVIVFTNVISATSHLQYISLQIGNPSAAHTTPQDIASAYISSTTVAWDGTVANSALYLAYYTTTGGSATKVTSLSQAQAAIGAGPAAAVTFAGTVATLMTACADQTDAANPIIYVSVYDVASNKTGFIVLDKNLNTILPPVPNTITTSPTVVLNLASAAQNGMATIVAECSNSYAYDPGIPSNFVQTIFLAPAPQTVKSVFSSGATTLTITTTNGIVPGMFIVDATTAGNITFGTTVLTVTAPHTITISAGAAGNSASTPGDTLSFLSATNFISARSVGLASKAFIANGQVYCLTAYESPFQPTYFLMNATLSTEANPIIVAKLAWENGGGYLTTGLPSVSVNDSVAQLAYLYQDFITTFQTANNTVQTTTNPVYSQTGVNLASILVGDPSIEIDSAEIGSSLNLSGGFGWMFDGYLPVEQNFFLYPDSVEATWSTTGGAVHAQPDGATNTNAYWYQAIYSWSDNQGNIHRSANSIPIPVTTTGSGTTGSITVHVPTLRLTYKISSPISIALYRWSVANQVYSQVTSVTSPTLNSTTSDAITFVDTQVDASIIGNAPIYTTGGVIEDVGPPAYSATTLFDTRQWLIDAEDPNLLWYSKQVIEATPVEWSDLLTYYVAPNAGTTQSTGPMRALAPMDDKLIIFKRDAIYYINGSGPDNTGANNGYSQPIFITSTVGCEKPHSIVLTPSGLMFQSDKGIWLLGRDLTTMYVGAPVEQFNAATVNSAVTVPGTNQVRFTLSSGQTLMYDYYYGQWGIFVGVPAISSTIYQDLHTFMNAQGQVYQETPGLYVDGDQPVLLGFTTGWIALQGISGYQRLYELQFLGEYITPHRWNIQIGYNFGAQSEQAIIQPLNFTGLYGSDSLYGQTTPYGGFTALEQWRIQPSVQKCQSFQISLQEVYDPTLGVPAGAGFTLSTVTCTVGILRSYRPVPAGQTSGTS